MSHPERLIGLVFASGGSGAHPSTRETFIAESLEFADMLEREGMGPLVERTSRSATRIQLCLKDPRGWDESRRQLSEHSPRGSALTMRNYQARRPSLHDFEEKLKATLVPTLILAGDDDEPVLQTSLFLKRCLPASGLHVMARTGHAMNLEEPAAFNGAVHQFLCAAELGQWKTRDLLAKSDVTK